MEKTEVADTTPIVDATAIPELNDLEGGMYRDTDNNHMDLRQEDMDRMDQRDGCRAAFCLPF